MTGYQKVVTSYTIKKSVSAELESAKTTPIKSRIEDNVRRSTRQRGHLQDSKIVSCSETTKSMMMVIFFHFAPKTEFEPIKMEEVLVSQNEFVL